jgi:hypothetical protein
VSFDDHGADLVRALRQQAIEALKSATATGIVDRASLPHDERPTSDQIIDWCELELGIKLRAVPRVLAIFRVALAAFNHKQMLRLVVLGPRGGGKTKLTAIIELVAYRWFGYDWHNLGGSFDQASLCYSYIMAAHASSPRLRNYTASSTARLTRSRSGARIKVAAASQAAVRGPHPVGPSGGGGLTLDEAAIIPDAIIDAAKGQLTSADPSALIQLSTMGDQQAGRFWELIQNPKAAGYRFEQFDIFDVVKRCPYDCKTTCPVREHFAQDYYEGPSDARQLIHKAYCGGRAHDVDGWVPVDEIAQQWKENPRSTFERELMGRAVSVVGSVYDPTLLDAACLPPRALSKEPEQHRRRFMAVDKFVGIDWGFAGECAIVYLIRLRDTLIAYRWEFFTRERFQVIREHVLARCFEERVEVILADSANPSDNEELAEMSSKLATERKLDWNPKVLPVVFSKWKAYGIGEVRRRLEQGLLKFATVFGSETVVAHDRALAYLKGYHTDKNGIPVKVDDHGPDALLCAVIGSATSFRAATSFVGSK